MAKSGGVSDLDAGVYHYAPRTHGLELFHTGDFAAKLRAACVDQAWVEEAAINVVLTAAFERTTTRYGSRGIQYAFQESGHVGQNIYLAAASMDIGTSVIGAFDEDEVRNILGVGHLCNARSSLAPVPSTCYATSMAPLKLLWTG